MSDAESPPATEDAILTAPDVVLGGDGFKAGESREGDTDAEAHRGAEIDRVEEYAEPCGDDMVAAEPVGIAEDPDQADVTKADEPDEDVGVEVQTDEVSAAADDLKEAGAATTLSTMVNDPTEVGVQTYEVAAAVADLSEVGAALVDDSKIVSAGVLHTSDSQTGEKVDGGSLDDIDEASDFVSDIHDDGACMEKDVAVSVDDEPVQDDEQQIDVATDMINVVEAEVLKSGNLAADEGTNVNAEVQSEDYKEVEDVGMFSAAVAHEKDKHLVAATMIRVESKENDTGLTSSVATDEGIQTDEVVTMEYYNEQKEGATADDNHTEEVGMQTDVVTMTGIKNEEISIYGENTQDEALDVAVGMVSPEEKVQTDEAANDVPEEEAAQMDLANLTGNDNEQKEVPIAAADEMEQDTMQMGATARTNDEDPEEGTDDEDVAEEAAVGTVGENVLEEQAAHENEEDDDDEPPPLLTMKGEGHRKRGRPSSKAQPVVKPSAKKKDEEEVCFICFDGGDLVICDRRGCPKAYHPSCVNRDDDFFKSKGRWNCGWHICSNCQKPARHMCYTCTYSLCKACIKETKFVCVRGFKGFCDTCINTVMMIENKEEATDQMDVDFDDKTSWWYLFKEYWLNLKATLSLTVEEISGAKSQKNRSFSVVRDNNLDELPDNNDEANFESSLGMYLESSSSKKKGRKRSKQAIIEDVVEGKKRTTKSVKQNHSTVCDTQTSGKKARRLSRRALSSQTKESESVGTSTSSAEEAGWASEELLNFVAHMRNGDKSVMTQFDVQHLLLEYIKRKKLRDPRRKSQIVCDSMLQSLFAKERVGHFEMLKLLESHFFMSEVSPVDADDNHGGVVNPDPSQDADGNSEASVVMSSEKRRKSRKYDQKGRQPTLNEYAAIDNHNIGLMYLRRNIMEELINDVDSFDEKVAGSFVRIRIPGTGQRQDIYRLVQVVGTGRASETYKCGKKTTDITLDILNLDKREVVTIDIISNQEFTEDECKRLRQSIKYGFIPRLTVGEVQEKARVLQAVKASDWIESEKMRLGHLRDRASDMGHRKELRECVEKLKLLSTPEERARRLNEEPEIHVDSSMDPDYESPEEQEQEIGRSSFNKSKGSFSRKDGNVASPSKGDGRNVSQRDSKANWESNRNTWAEPSSHMESPLARRSTFASSGESAGSNIGAQTVKIEATVRCAPQGPSGAISASQSAIIESEKTWQYMDPTNKIQGPFSIVQLRKWNSNGYFPPDLKIWKVSEKQDDSILLSDALMGKFEKDLPPWEPPHVTSSQIDKTVLRSNSDVGTRHCDDTLESTKSGELTPKSVGPNRSQSFSGRDQSHDYGTNNHGPTLIQSHVQDYYGMQNSQAAYASQQSLAGSWNAPSQVGVTINPMTPIQPAMGVYSGNMGNLTPVPVPAPSNAEMVNSALPSQNTMLADRSESNSGKDSSHGTLKSSGEGLGPLGAQPGPTQMSNQQALADTRNQISSTNASNSMMPSQHTSAQSAEPVQHLATANGSGDSQCSGRSMPQVANTTDQAQVAGNVSWGTVFQGDTSMGWGTMGQSNMSMPWGGAPAQGATYNMNLTMPTQPNAVPNMGWAANPGNTNMNMMWAAAQGQGTPNAASMMGAQMQGVAMAPWGGIAPGNANAYPGWGTQSVNVNQNVGWNGAVQGSTGQGNNNMNRNSSNGRPEWNNQQRGNGDRHSGNPGGFNAGGSWKLRSGGDRGRMGVCYEFMKHGVCKRAICRYVHPDKHMDRQHSGNERRYDQHNERNDRQFDRQPSVNERHDVRHNQNDDGGGDDNQADRCQ